ncbi:MULTISPECIES: hypothetical protein [Prosthecochloris]|uniref:Histidine kinase n=1 Tax=Prosthecochloris vibrioformis TaxID=1098 RepID=A0A5C4RZT2_PROVB|nr:MULTISPECIES: hypothetical protein [Prosthecochloris]ANT65363.1 rod shape-determining protein MreD [Prosthecochloris sp. CIB 2401]TNJ36237.1 histidine kinase [Prosthecochloris vibrioformis]
MPKKILSYSLVLLLLTLVQLLLVSRMSFMGITPDIISIMVVYTALRHGRTGAMNIGFAGGLLLGFFTGNMGAEALAKTIEGFVAGSIHLPEESHASASQKQRYFYKGLLIASIAGNTVTGMLLNAHLLPVPLNLFLTLVIGTAMTMLTGVIAYQLLLGKILTRK